MMCKNNIYAMSIYNILCYIHAHVYSYTIIMCYTVFINLSETHNDEV